MESGCCRLRHLRGIFDSLWEERFGCALEQRVVVHHSPGGENTHPI